MMLWTVFAFWIPVLFSEHGQSELIKERFCSACEFIIDEIERRIEGSKKETNYDVQVGFRMGNKRKSKLFRSEEHILKILDEEMEPILAKYSKKDEKDSEDIQRTKKALTQVYRYMTDDNEEEMVKMYMQSMDTLDIKKRICLELTTMCSQKTELTIALVVENEKAGIKVDANDNGFTVTARSKTNPELRKGDVIVAINGESLVKKKLKIQSRIWKANQVNDALLTVKRPNGLGFNINTLRDRLETMNEQMEDFDVKGKKIQDDPRHKILNEILYRQKGLKDVLDANSRGLRVHMNLLIDTNKYDEAGKIDTKLEEIQKMRTSLTQELRKTNKEVEDLRNLYKVDSTEEKKHTEL